MRPLVTIAAILTLVTPALASDPPALISSWGGTGSGPGQFNHPRDVAVAPNSNVYVVDRDNSRVQYFTSSGGYLGEWGTSGTGPGQFQSPHGIAIDTDGNVYVTDLPDRVQKFTATGDYLMTFADEHIARPLGIAVDGEGNLYLGNTHRLYVSKFDATGQFVMDFTAFSSAYSLELDGHGCVLVSNQSGPHLQRFTADGTLAARLAPSGIPEDHARGLGVDQAGNALFVWWSDETPQDKIHVWAHDAFQGLDSWYPPTPPGGSTPQIEDLAVTPDGVVYLADFGNDAILKVQYTVPVPTVTSTWGRLKSIYR